MASRRIGSAHDLDETKPRRPATTPEQRENQLISLAVDEAERQLRAGTASSQVISHFLKLGSSREKLEQARLEQEVEFMKMKQEALAAQQQIQELYAAALDAMRSYSGQPKLSLVEDDDDFERDIA